ncbi:MAG: hypothetical protein ACE362_21345 [Phaeodactylibacter xiamenensis]|uniref:Uncharacterized protein n=1 Tax=Phaeodactylibacter xiamenensis TaxID=1524460 RepID=A0A098S3V6_9BACT|nr:hypothetical protein [Phaeodactylibacter xiamenensis]KGE86518.1 hypothetical protein IX84_21040 [Phaeodactylibacter xiamenensis]MCR9050881.1 hypothetical protein [bacterium]
MEKWLAKNPTSVGSSVNEEQVSPAELLNPSACPSEAADAAINSKTPPVSLVPAPAFAHIHEHKPDDQH